jgi:hypothetical protein
VLTVGKAARISTAGSGGGGGGGAFLIMSNDVVCGYKSDSIYSRPALELSLASSAIIKASYFSRPRSPKKDDKYSKNKKKIERERDGSLFFRDRENDRLYKKKDGRSLENNNPKCCRQLSHQRQPSETSAAHLSVDPFAFLSAQSHPILHGSRCAFFFIFTQNFPELCIIHTMRVGWGGCLGLPSVGRESCSYLQVE